MNTETRCASSALFSLRRLGFRQTILKGNRACVDREISEYINDHDPPRKFSITVPAGLLGYVMSQHVHGAIRPELASREGDALCE